MNNVYLLIICLLLAPFTGCIEDSGLELVEDTDDSGLELVEDTDEPDNTEEEKSENEEKTEERPTEQWTFYRNFVECDPNNDSIVAYGEFVDCLNMDLVNDGESIVAASSEFANEMFSMADLDMDGNLTSSEFDYIKIYPHFKCELVPYGHCSGKYFDEYTDLSGMNLTGIDLSYAELPSANLSGANLEYANLANVSLHSADLKYADLSNADLTGASARFADLTGANLYGANLTDTYLESANLTNADLNGADLNGAWLYRADLSHANFLYADLTYAYLESANLVYAVLTDVSLYGAMLSHTNLTGANLEGADLTGANLVYADLTDAIVTDADFTDTLWHNTIWIDGVAYHENQAITEEEPVEGCMDSDATNYDLTAEIDDGSCEYPDTCPSGSAITGDTGDAGYANPGVVFSENSNLPDEHDPKRIMFTVTLNGSVLEDCIVKSEIEEGNGWFFSSNNRTNSDGEIYGYWTAGSEIGLQTMRAYVTWPDGEKKYANVTGEVSDTSSRTNSIHLNYYPSGTYDSFSVQATPGTGPAATYYSTINWRGAYGGIQFDGSTTKVIFSTWDANEMDAEIRDSGDCNDVVDFGGEGTGVSCRLLFPPSEYGAIPGLPDDYMLVPGHTYDTTIEITDCGTNCQDYSFNFTDVTRGFGPISLGTQRYKDDAPNDYASSFVEEWTPHGNCLSAERSVLYHDIKARVDGVWETIDTARFTPNYYRSNNEICANYFAEGTELGFLMSSGGERLVGPPRIDGDSAFPNTRYLYIVEN
jgi:uncharacterized protein YjbI with pentapeptide repeats